MAALIAYETSDGSGPAHAEDVGALQSYCGRWMFIHAGVPWPSLRSIWPQDAVLCPQCERMVYEDS